MIVVDTSVWVDANRRPLGEIAHALRGLIDADEVAVPLPVRLELMAGLARHDRGPFLRALRALPVVHPTDETWETVERWVPMAADRGQRFALTDLIIGALADQVGGIVWSLDDDFARLEALGVIQRFLAV